MKQFTFEPSLNKYGRELIDLYKKYYEEDTSDLMKTAIEEIIKKQKSLDIKRAITHKLSFKEFEALVKTRNEYFTSSVERNDAAIKFTNSYLGADCRADAIAYCNDIIIQKKIGLKKTDFAKYFGTDEKRTDDCFKNGFCKMFVDTRIRKLIDDVLTRNKKLLPKYTNIKVSACYKSPDRPMYDIDIDFYIPIDNLNDELIVKIADIIKEIEDATSDFTI